MRHLGSRVSALIDGQLSPAEEAAAWAHVHGCHLCRDQVEREGWVKRQLLGLGGAGAPEGLKSSLGDPGSCLLARPRRQLPTVSGMVALGGGALGAAALGMVALVGPGSSAERPPTTSITRPSGTTQSPVPVRSETSTRLGVSPVGAIVETRRVRVGMPGARLVP